jgi:hypothetical protein
MKKTYFANNVAWECTSNMWVYHTKTQKSEFDYLILERNKFNLIEPYEYIKYTNDSHCYKWVNGKKEKLNEYELNLCRKLSKGGTQ